MILHEGPEISPVNAYSLTLPGIVECPPSARWACDKSIC